jgi:type IV secretion system protein VirD4
VFAYANNAIVLGKAYGRLLGYTGPSNVWVCAPPRTRKTWSIVFPTLLTYGHSVIVNDLRGECYEMTAGYRALSRRRGGLGQRVLTYNPASLATHRHNPLQEIRLGVMEVKDARNIVDMLIDPDATKDRRDHWDHAVSPALTATILHLLYCKPVRQQTLEGVAYFLADAARNVTEALEEMRTTNHLGDKPHPVVASMAQELLQKSPNDRSGVISTAMDYVGIYRDPLIANLTRTSDFCLRDLQFGPVPVSLYLMIPPADLSGTRPVVRVFLNQLTARLMEDHHAPGRRELLQVYDEFNALRKVEFLGERFAYMGGYQMRALIINQSVPQLWDTWGRDEPITATCDVKVLFTASDRATAEACAELVTKTTAMRQQRGFTGDRWSPFFQRRSVSGMEVERPLLTPEEMLLFPLDKMAVFVMGQPRIQGDKLNFTREKWLHQRCLPPPPCLLPYDEPEEEAKAPVPEAAQAPVPSSPPGSPPGSPPEPHTTRWVV